MDGHLPTSPTPRAGQNTPSLHHHHACNELPGLSPASELPYTPPPHSSPPDPAVPRHGAGSCWQFKQSGSNLFSNGSTQDAIWERGVTDGAERRGTADAGTPLFPHRGDPQGGGGLGSPSPRCHSVPRGCDSGHGRPPVPRSRKEV